MLLDEREGQSETRISSIDTCAAVAFVDSLCKRRSDVPTTGDRDGAEMASCVVVL